MIPTRQSHHELREGLANWREIVRPYQGPDHRQAIWQIVNTLIPLVALWTATYLSLRWSIYAAALLAVPTAFFLSRFFCLQHDCGHYSFVRGRRANEALGFFFSLFTSLPFHYWATVHRAHHKHTGGFDGRGVGDMPFLRIKEYEKLPRWQRALYRLYRAPLFLFGVGPLLYLVISQRIPLTPGSNPAKTIRRQLINNLAIALVYGLLGSLLGWREFFIVQGMVLSYFATIAVWVFHVQHLHEHTVKLEASEKTHLASAMRGASHYDLPAVLHWLTGNIGFHHIHHLSPSIPNYKLPTCHREQPLLTQYATSVTLKESLSQIHSDLWDDTEKRMISFAELAQREQDDDGFESFGSHVTIS